MFDLLHGIDMSILHYCYTSLEFSLLLLSNTEILSCLFLKKHHNCCFSLTSLWDVAGWPIIAVVVCIVKFRSICYERILPFASEYISHNVRKHLAAPSEDSSASSENSDQLAQSSTLIRKSCTLIRIFTGNILDS